MKIGERIKLRRIELGWSLQELADRMGYANKSSVARIESGEIDPPQSKVVKFSEVLNTSITYLMGWDEDKKESSARYDGTSEKRQALIDFAMTVPEDKAEMILKVMKSILGDS
jgi:transcriptional regulator with XRE-family HTH domain